jgi:hypothetical protein
MFGKKKGKKSRDPRLDGLLAAVKRLHADAYIDEELEVVRAPAFSSAVRFRIVEDLATFNGCADSLGVQKEWIMAEYAIGYFHEVSRADFAELVLQLTAESAMYRVQSHWDEEAGVIVIVEWVPFSTEERDNKIFTQRMLSVNLVASDLCNLLANNLHIPTPREVEYGEKFA